MIDYCSLYRVDGAERHDVRRALEEDIEELVVNREKQISPHVEDHAVRIDGDESADANQTGNE